MTEVSPLDYLFSLEQHGIKLGLEKIGLLCEALGHPENAFRSIVVAGTNGKGSVAAMVDTALRHSGFTTGRFTSPHLIDLEERFAIQGEPVGRQVLSDLVADLRRTIRALETAGHLDTPPTFFEAATALAFLLFEKRGVDIAVLEVGMGGRFDATNVVTPTAVGITTIDLDHQQFLGRTLPAIAFEKAGVIKPGTLVVTGETKPPALEVLERTCREQGARLVQAGHDTAMRATLRDGLTAVQLTTPVDTYGPLVMALSGRHQVANAAVVVRVLEELDLPSRIGHAAIEAGLVETQWPGRLQLLNAADGRQVLLDAAHNVAAAEALGRYLHEVYPDGVPLVLAAMRDKDVAGMIKALEPFITRIVCTSLDNPRALSADALADIATATCPGLPVAIVGSPADALTTAWQSSRIVCAAGSVYLAGELSGLPSIHAGTAGGPRVPG